MSDRPLPSEIQYQLKIWKKMAIGLRSIHALLAIIATLASLLVAAKINSFEPVQIEWLAFTAAAATGLLAAFDLGSKANRARTAWRMLNAAVLRYQNDPNYKLQSLIDTYETAETIIGDVKEQPR